MTSSEGVRPSWVRRLSNVDAIYTSKPAAASKVMEPVREQTNTASKAYGALGINTVPKPVPVSTGSALLVSGPQKTSYAPHLPSKHDAMDSFGSDKQPDSRAARTYTVPGASLRSSQPNVQTPVKQPPKQVRPDGNPKASKSSEPAGLMGPQWPSRLDIAKSVKGLGSSKQPDAAAPVSSAAIRQVAPTPLSRQLARGPEVPSKQEPATSARSFSSSMQSDAPLLKKATKIAKHPLAQHQSQPQQADTHVTRFVSQLDTSSVDRWAYPDQHHSC